MVLTRGRPQSPAKLPFSIDGYDGLKVAEILPLVPVLGDVNLTAVRRREAPLNCRLSVLRRTDRLLDGTAATGESKSRSVPGTDEEHVIDLSEPVGGGGAAKGVAWSAGNP
jgi:hypothetical protein